MTKVESDDNTRLHTSPIKKEVAEGHFQRRQYYQQMTRGESDDNTRLHTCPIKKEVAEGHF